VYAVVFAAPIRPSAARAARAALDLHTTTKTTPYTHKQKGYLSLQTKG
jgi:hypothetical protein